MSALKYIMKRTLWSVAALIGLSILIFSLSRMLPGDPARMALGPRAPEYVVEELRVEMRLDQPLHIQYGYWASGVVRGDFGRSLMTRRAVSQDIRAYLPATIELVIFAATVQVIFGIALGVLSTMYNGRWVDNIIRIVAYLGIVTPAFVFGVIFLLIFGYLWPILPAAGRLSVEPAITGMTTVDSLLKGDFSSFFRAISHFILPGTALAMNGVAQLARVTRSSMVDNLKSDYVDMAFSQGLNESKIMFKYLLRPSLIPSVSMMAMQFAILFSNAFLVELIFNWPGLSRYGVNAMLYKDFNAIIAVVLVLGIVFIIANILADTIIALLDPRIRLQAGKGA